MLCSISQAGFASEHWNALKKNFQHIPSQLENTFSKCRWRGSHICAAAAGLLGRMPTLLYKDQVNCVESIHYITHCRHPDPTLLGICLFQSSPVTCDSKWFPNPWRSGCINTEKPTVCQASLNPQATCDAGIIVPILQMIKLKLREVIALGSGYQAKL